MINRDARCVFVADSLGLAEVVAAWLGEQGFPAQTMDTATLGGLEGLTWASPTAVSSRGIEVWVLDPAHIGPAKQLIQEQADAVASKQAKQAALPESIEVVCEECGHHNLFPGSASGKVETCANCQAYLDVPSPDDDWSDFDAGEEEQEAPPERTTGPDPE